MVTPPSSSAASSSAISASRPVKSRGGEGSWCSALTVGDGASCTCLSPKTISPATPPVTAVLRVALSPREIPLDSADEVLSLILCCSLPAPRVQLLAHHCGVGVFDLLKNLERRVSTSDGQRAVTEFNQCEGSIPQRRAFPSAVADLASNGQPLLIELNRASGLAQGI